MRMTSHDCVADRNLKEGASGVGFLYVAMEMEGRDFLPRSPLRHSQKPRSFHIIRLRAKGKQRGEHRGFGRQQAKQPTSPSRESCRVSAEFCLTVRAQC